MKKDTTRAPRYGNYSVTRIAGTPRESLPQPVPPATPKRPNWQTLWADRPLQLPQGRAVGIRRCCGEVEVAFISKNDSQLRWEPAARVLKAADAKAWASASGFRPA